MTSVLILTHSCHYAPPRNLRVTPERVVASYEVELYTDGAGFSVLNGQKTAHRRGNVLIAFPGDRRYSIDTFVCHSFKFFPNGDADLVNALQLIHGIHQVSCSEELIPHFYEIYALSGKQGSELLLDAEMRCILSRIYRDLYLKILKRDSYNESLENAAAYIAKNFNKKLTLADISSAVCMSPSYFHKCFKQYYAGVSPNKYLLNKRIDHAKALLSNNTLTLDEIAQMSGFSSRAYFDVCFKKETGLTPAAFRTQINSRIF